MSDYRDLTNLSNRLGNAARRAPKDIDTKLLEAGEEIKTNMLRLVPRKTGYLASKIVIIHSPGRVQVGPVGVKYSDYVEFGTGIRGEFPTKSYVIKPKNGQYLTFMVGGKFVRTKQVTHPGIRARPYIRPAARQYFDKLGPEVADIGAKLVSGK